MVDRRGESIELFKHDISSDFADALSAAGTVAWDVETSGLDWRHDRLGTCQLHAPTVGTAVVQLTDTPPTLLARQLGSSDVVKIFHHAPFDLRFLVNEWSVTPAAIRCTKIASKLLSPAAPNSEHSLQSLLNRTLGVWLDKGAVRVSDWRASQLDAQQVAYAAQDVEYLLPLAQVLTEQLSTIGLTALYNDCCAFIPARVRLELDDYPDVFAY